MCQSLFDVVFPILDHNTAGLVPTFEHKRTAGGEPFQGIVFLSCQVTFIIIITGIEISVRQSGQFMSHGVECVLH